MPWEPPKRGVLGMFGHKNSESLQGVCRWTPYGGDAGGGGAHSAPIGPQAALSKG